MSAARQEPGGVRGVAVMAVLLIASAGCAAVPGPDDSASVAIDAREYGRIYRAAGLVLGEGGFVLDRQDYRFGVISTRPRFSPTLLEPWHRDNTTAAITLQSTFNQERRIVEVTLAPEDGSGDGQGGYVLAVKVVMERRRTPDRYMTGAMDALAMVGQLQPPPGDVERARALEPYWRHVGRDAELERRLLAAIVRRSLELPVEEGAAEPPAVP